MKLVHIAALCCAVVAGSAMPAHAQYYGPPPGPLFSNWLRGIPNVISSFGNGYGYHGAYRRPPPPGWCPPGQQMSRPVMHREEHPFASGGYRCFADGRPSGGPGTGTGWCQR